jgi:hypothetical protein
MTTAPSGDAMTVRFADPERLKREPLPEPIAWYLHPADARQFAAAGKHCEIRRCHRPQAVNVWRYWRSTEVGRILLSERQVCLEHGREFASRHGIPIDPIPESGATPKEGITT